MLNKTTTNPQDDFAKVCSMITEAQFIAWLRVNQTLIQLYWNIGQYVSERVEKNGWGMGIVEEMAKYIAKKTPSHKGFSARNIWRMKQFYETYREHEKLSHC